MNPPSPSDTTSFNVPSTRASCHSTPARLVSGAGDGDAWLLPGDGESVAEGGVVGSGVDDAVAAEPAEVGADVDVGAVVPDTGVGLPGGGVPAGIEAAGDTVVEIDGADAEGATGRGLSPHAPTLNPMSATAHTARTAGRPRTTSQFPSRDARLACSMSG